MKKLILALLMVLSGCFTNIEPSEVGVLINKCSGGGVQEDPLTTGWHFIGPFCEDVIEFPTKVNSLVLSKSLHEGASIDTSLHIQSKENMDLSTDVTLNYAVLPVKAPAFYKKWKIDGTNIQHFENTFLVSLIRENLRAEVVKYTAETVYANQENIRVAVEMSLSKRLESEGIHVENFSINQIRVPESVKTAIEAKVAAIQTAEAAKNKITQITAQAEQVVAEAKGAAEAKRLAADAEAYKITTITKALNPAYIELTKATKWNGELPRVQSGTGGMILQMKD